MKPHLWQTIVRSGLLRCPDCGQGRFAKNWRETHEECSQCGFDFRVEGGFYLGSIYLNYGLMAVIMLAAGMPLVWFGYVSPLVASVTGVLLSVPFATLFWRYARSQWLGFGYYIDHNVRAGKKDVLSEVDSNAKEQTYADPSEEALNSICYFCHKRIQFAESRLKLRVACPFCQENILLTRLVGTNVDDDQPCCLPRPNGCEPSVVRRA